MRIKTVFQPLASAAFLQTVLAVGTDDQVNAKIDYGTFENPSANVRPRFRYWIPDASVDLDQVAADIKDAGKIGAGGIELLGYYDYGGVTFATDIIPTDWTKYGWGTPAWRKLQDAALKAVDDNGLIIDLSLGPNQGAGVPAQYNSDGLQWDLQPFNITVPVGGTFDDVLPGWGTGPLVSASTGLLTNTTNQTSAIYKTLSQSSLADVTSQVGSDGRAKLNFSSGQQGESFVVFAYYLVHTGYREQQSPELVIPGVPQSPVTHWIQNGSWVVDHFSTRGAQTVIDFWQNYLLNGSDTAQLLKKIGNYVWEDSQEFPANVYWTPALPAAFEANHAYTINKYLPILLHGNSGIVIPGFGSSATPTYYVTDEVDGGDSHVADYRQTLTGLNTEYLHTLTRWAQAIGVQSSAQVVYNLPMDMLANIPDVNAPETETLGFDHNIDAYRQFVGPANLAGKRIISSEAGAVMREAFQQTIPELLWDIKRSVVAGVNNFILHGMPYSGNYPNATWPTWTTFSYLFSEMHNRHQPGWDFYDDFMNYIARVQYVSQTGVPKRDIVFWLKDTSYATVPTRYQPTDLQDAGYTYEYLSPDNFDLPAAQVSSGVLAPTRQAFKAIVLRGNDTLTASGVTKLAQWAQQGLPVIISGGLPSNISGTNTTASAHINATLSQLLSLKNVHSVPYANLAGSLADLGIHPRAAVTQEPSSNTTWYSNWREDVDKKTSYIFLYNDATGLPRGTGSSTRNVTFDTSGTPYIYDAWTGKKTPVFIYQQSKHSITLPITLSGNQTTIIAFDKTRNHPKPKPHIKHSTGKLISIPGTNQLMNSNSNPCKITFSNDTTLTFPPSTLPPLNLSNWTLTIESWTPPSNLFDIQATQKQNKTYTLPSLLPWSKIPNANLSHVSGRGYYKTHFTWPDSTATTGAYLHLNAIIHTAKAYLNGHLLPPLDVTDAKVDITPFLEKGVNEVEVVVATPYGNAVALVWENLRSYGNAPLVLAGAAVPGVAEYGLVGDVTVVTYVGVSV